MILLWGTPGDTPMAQVHRALLDLGQAVTFFDQRDILEAEVRLRIGRKLEGELRVADRQLDLNTVSGVYLRLYGLDQLPCLRDLARNGASWAHAIAFTENLSAWVDSTDALVVNRLSAMASNSSKPLQQRLIQEHGFEVPDTLITTNVDAAVAFWDKHSAVIYKSISGVRSIVAQLTHSHKDKLELLQWCPTQFQEFIPGCDYRVHVIGSEVFACEIVSSADDYRYAARIGADARVRECTIPMEVAERCRRLSAALGLPVTGIDLRRHPDGRWYCFEVNPSPAFSYFQSATGQPIDLAIARLLSSPGSEH